MAENPLVYTWFDRFTSEFPEGASAGIIALYTELYPTKVPVTETKIWTILASSHIVIGRDSGTNQVVAMATIGRLSTLSGIHGYVRDSIITGSHRDKPGLQDAHIAEIRSHGRQMRVTLHLND